MTTRTTTSTLVWECETCHLPVADGQGYLHVDLRAVGLVQVAHKAYDDARVGVSSWEPVNLGELMKLPQATPWMVHHASCDPDPDVVDYWLSIERVRTHAHLLSWTAHLMEKNWLEHTNWSNLIARMAGVEA